MAKSKHDPFVSKSLEHPAIAMAFLKQGLPDYLKGHIILKNLDRIDRTNTDVALKKHHQDIVYRVPTNKQIDVIVSVEHQSKADSTMVVRILRYNLHVLEAYTKKGYSKWPLIIPILLYNGRKRPYPYPCETSDYYGNSEWGKKEMYYRFYLLDLSQLSDKEILDHGICAPLELLLKHSFDGAFELKVEAYRKVFHACIKEVGDEYIHTMLEYCTSLSNLKIGEKMFNFTKEVFKDKSKIIMTYAQVLTKEAKQEGIQQGIHSRDFDIVKNMLQKECDIAFIQEITGLSKEAIANLKQEIENSNKKSRVA
jgi:predicted transposase/invertase (TIGR01784 family)